VADVSAARADSEELNIAAEYLIAAGIITLTPQKIKGWGVKIVHPSAPHATDVKVAADVAVEAGLLAAQLQLLDQSKPRKQFQVAIHGPQTDIWQAAADNLIQPNGSGVGSELPELLQDHFSLSSIAMGVVNAHGY